MKVKFVAQRPLKEFVIDLEVFGEDSAEIVAKRYCEAQGLKLVEVEECN